MIIEDIGNKCCGCRACIQKCPHNAILIETDCYGFEYPKIDKNKCISCGLCNTVCPIINNLQSYSDDICGMAYAYDEKIKHNGSSGGLFGTFAKAVLDKDGVVFGAAFDEKLQLKTQMAENYEQLEPLYKSKYLLCNTNYQFDFIEKALKQGKSVLYCSSPCQIAALRLFLKKEYDNLLLIDFICHGVGSQTLFDRSIDYIEQKKSIKIKQFIFRCKKSNASSHYYQFKYYKLNKDKCYQKSDLYFSFPYYYAYCKQLVYRDSCYECKYATKERVGDITIGDFHSVEKYFPKVDRFAGVSMFLVNTEKGKKWFNNIKEKICWKLLDKEILYKNNRFSSELNIPHELPLFRESIANFPFEKTLKKYLNPSKDWKKLIYYKLPKPLRKVIRKVK